MLLLFLITAAAAVTVDAGVASAAATATVAAIAAWGPTAASAAAVYKCDFKKKKDRVRCGGDCVRNHSHRGGVQVRSDVMLSLYKSSFM